MNSLVAICRLLYPQEASIATLASASLNDLAAGHTVVDLLPNEHRSAWVPDASRYALVRPEFVVADGKPAGHAGKAAKGRVARLLLASGRIPSERLDFGEVAVTF